MSVSVHMLLSAFLRIGAIALVVNEIRGLILAAPVMYGLYKAGGTPMAIWIAICSLAGIALSVIVPIFAAKKLQAFSQARRRA